MEVTSAGIDKNGLHEPFAWYLQQHHYLIRRHSESLELHGDLTASWELSIDLELPADQGGCWKTGDGRLIFPFPLVFLKKVEGRMAFSICDESGTTLPIPIRSECDNFSTRGLGVAAEQLLAKIKRELPSEDLAELRERFERIVTDRPYPAAMALLTLRQELGLESNDDGTEVDAQSKEIGEYWRENGLNEVLQMLVEHSLIWVGIWGRPGERRTIVLREEKVLERRAFVRWAFGRMEKTKWSWLRPGAVRRRRRAECEILKAKAAEKVPEPRGALSVGDRPYGRRKRTISFSALGERIGQPLAWMPFEFEFPTIYRMRCGSYHFELKTEVGRSPRDLRVAAGPALAEPSQREEIERPLPRGTRRTLTSSVARLDIPASLEPDRPEALDDDLWFRITVGIGDGAFPILWFLAAAITAVMLWVLADAHPEFATGIGGFDSNSAQIVAGILLVVPALISALAIGSNEVPVTRLIGGARILLLVSGLSAVVAAAVVAGAKPLGMGAEGAWSACAIAATAATVPLGTSWLLSSPIVWFRLKKISSRRRQWGTLAGGILLALLGIAGLICLCDDPIGRASLAAYLLALTVILSVIANDRAAMKVNVSRNYIAVSFLSAGFICLALGCIELRGAVGDSGHLQYWAERAAVLALMFSLVSGALLHRVTRTRLFRPKPDEIHVSPTVGKAILAKEKVLELATLRQRQNEAKEAAAG